jgi:hypothetical protein
MDGTGGPPFQETSIWMVMAAKMAVAGIDLYVNLYNTNLDKNNLQSTNLKEVLFRIVIPTHSRSFQ